MAPLDISQFPEYRQIPLTKGYFAIVDAENYEWLAQWNWHVLINSHNTYAVRKRPRIRGKRGPEIYMHGQIMGTSGGMDTDHRNGSGLMNIQENLRVCTRSQNNMNQRPQKNTSSKYKGVTWDKARKKWMAKIQVDGKNINLGRFTVETDAANAYNTAALKHFGEFARLNIIPESEAA